MPPRATARPALRAAPDDTPRGRHIDPTAVYSQREAARLLGMDVSRLREEVAAARLKERANANRREYLGRWLLDWYELPGDMARDDD